MDTPFILAMSAVLPLVPVQRMASFAPHSETATPSVKASVVSP